jgi:hypothetical protein
MEGTMPHTAELNDGDLVVVEDRQCFFNGLYTVALWPDLMAVYHGPGLSKGLAQAYAIDLARTRGTFAWDLTFALPERLVVPLESEPSTSSDVIPRITQDLAIDPSPEERLAKVKAQTQVLAEAVIALSETFPSVAPAILAVKTDVEPRSRLVLSRRFAQSDPDADPLRHGAASSMTD